MEWRIPDDRKIKLPFYRQAEAIWNYFYRAVVSKVEFFEMKSVLVETIDL